jgi:putative transposase
MIDRTHELPIVRQCRILELFRTTAYYQPSPVSPDELARMRRIDELHLEHPFAGAWMLSRMLQNRRADFLRSMRASVTCARLRHVPTVFGLIP